jgi:transposase-like protein
MDGVEANGEDRQTADPGKRIRRQWTAGEKRRIVREAERAGAVGREVAQRHGVHVSVLNRWRAELRVGATRAKKAVRTVRLLPVQVRKSPPSRAASASVRATLAVPESDIVEVAFPAGQRLKVRGVVDGGVLRTVLQELSRC